MARRKKNIVSVFSCEDDIEAWNLKYLDKKVFLEALKRQLVKSANSEYEILPHYDRIDVIAMQLVKKAASGDMEAIKEVIYRFDGKPKEASQVDSFNIHIDLSSSAPQGATISHENRLTNGKIIESITYRPIAGDE